MGPVSAVCPFTRQHHCRGHQTRNGPGQTGSSVVDELLAAAIIVQVSSRRSSLVIRLYCGAAMFGVARAASASTLLLAGRTRVFLGTSLSFRI